MTRSPEPRFHQYYLEDSLALRAELTASLLAQPARVSPKFFYDALGSRLFDAITELPEYYPTRTEREIFDRRAAEIAAATGTGRTLIDLGAGNGDKAARLFDALQPRDYVAIDISVDYLRDAMQARTREHPAIRMMGLGLDFSHGVDLPSEFDDFVGDNPRLFFYPGSSIGNFSPDEAVHLLQSLQGAARHQGQLLIGVDLSTKPKDVLLAAYDDALGVTAAFNRNVLRRLQALIGCELDLAHWRHVARYDADAGRVEMHLEATQPTLLRWQGGERGFERGERLHTENSHKYTLQGFSALLERGGWRVERHWTDDRQWFAVFLASVR